MTYTRETTKRIMRKITVIEPKNIKLSGLSEADYDWNGSGVLLRCLMGPRNRGNELND